MFETKFKNVSSKIINKFSAELGTCVFKRKMPTSTYDAVTGKHTPDFLSYDILVVYDAIDDREILDESFKAEHSLAYISGLDLPIVPMKNDVIIDQQGDELLISRVKTDQYKALYTCFIKELNQ